MSRFREAIPRDGPTFPEVSLRAQPYYSPLEAVQDYQNGTKLYRENPQTIENGRIDRNGYDYKDESVDVLYRNSRRQFANWEAKDILDAGLGGPRKSRKSEFDRSGSSEDKELEKAFKSPESLKRRSESCERCAGSSRSRNGGSRSKDRENGRQYGARSDRDLERSMDVQDRYPGLPIRPRFGHSKDEGGDKGVPDTWNNARIDRLHESDMERSRSRDREREDHSKGPSKKRIGVQDVEEDRKEVFEPWHNSRIEKFYDEDRDRRSYDIREDRETNRSANSHELLKGSPPVKRFGRSKDEGKDIDALESRHVSRIDRYREEDLDEPRGSIEERSSDRIRSMIERLRLRDDETARETSDRKDHEKGSWTKLMERSRARSCGRARSTADRIPSIDREIDERGPVDQGRKSMDPKENGRKSSIARTFEVDRERIESPSRDGRNLQDRGSFRRKQRSRDVGYSKTNCAIGKDDSSPRIGQWQFGRCDGQDRADRRTSDEVDPIDSGRSIEKDHLKDPAKRRSYSCEGSLDDFDVRIQKYERSGFRKDSEPVRRSSFKDRTSETRRKGSLKSKDRERSSKKESRHSRPLSPPKINDLEIREDPKDLKTRPTLSTKDWHESNRQFAARYIKDHSLIQDRIDPEDPDEDPESPSKRDFRSFGKGPKPMNYDPDEVPADRNEVLQDIGSRRRGTSCQDRNGTTTIKIRTAFSEDPAGNERRRRRRPRAEAILGRRGRYEEDGEADEDEDDDEEDFRRSRKDRLHGRRLAPSRTPWEYLEGGVRITDLEEGQPCLQCGETCPGFSPHSWRETTTEGSSEGFIIPDAARR
ncbi:peptidyl-prolyl cis-trans isomerase G isoform X2 [Orussus abietinus]|uniref:peptidyl-prolyl cis-trans isomerase G isoform X2 n=1 Tax=Orussus abietinus TaxID=222816 RepID=UPI000626394A|nr:peptidyl-prolyl cis-trans isomerase G isoform X2 [Orussus abietinus]